MLLNENGSFTRKAVSSVQSMEEQEGYVIHRDLSFLLVLVPKFTEKGRVAKCDFAEFSISKS